MLRPHPQHPHFNIGRKGSVIYYAWHDIPCARSYTKPHNPKTPKQQANRSLHGQLTRLSGKTKAFRQFGYSGLASYRSSHTTFIGIQMCQIKRQEVSSNKPLEAQLRWGHGSLPGASRMTFSWKKQPVLKWESDKRRLTRQTDPKNRVLWIVWNATRDAWQWSLGAGQRKDGTCTLNLPNEWKGEELNIRLLFYDSHKKRFSSDTCLHLKAGSETTSYTFEAASLFTSQGITFDQLILLWVTYRPLRDWDRKVYREKWFS